MYNIFSIDVEDWFHILELQTTPKIQHWATLPSCVEKNMHVLLDLLDEYQVKSTCFFLGWIAEKYPHLVKEVQKRGHEIASHGYNHQLIYTQTAKQFFEDISKSKSILENLIGVKVEGYRAPGFSITKNNLWALEELVRAGFSYDSSIFPCKRNHGGIVSANPHPHWIDTSCGKIFEFPISVASYFGKNMCYFGGGYLRLFPYSVIQKKSQEVNQEGRPVIYYIHPREIDSQHPRLKMGWIRTFKSYINLNSTVPKLKKIFYEQKLTSFGNWYHAQFSQSAA